MFLVVLVYVKTCFVTQGDRVSAVCVLRCDCDHCLACMQCVCARTHAMLSNVRPHQDLENGDKNEGNAEEKKREKKREKKKRKQNRRGKKK